jgi:hypothetical protein
MIIQQNSDPMVAIRQTDHAMLCGFFAREWGNEQYVKPEPFTSFCLATAEHDNGWQEWEMTPAVDPRSFAPYTFMSVPTAEHIQLYQRGIDRVVKTDLYAGLLVAGHCAGLYDRAKATMPDRLSLYFCLEPDHDTTIEGVPMDDSEREVDWELRAAGGNQFTLDPYPFRRAPLEFSILARRVPKRRYLDDADFQHVLSTAPFFQMRFSLRPGASQERSYAVGM